ncbi:hypothetical protein B1748_11945 [Paenibacillus sp. MY03]|nr:hypothetical protein B1748_11945 [Paenibacillus sp. MY03]
MLVMQRINGGAFRFALFRQFYAIFFLLVLVPSILASLLVYFHIVGIIEREVNRSSGIVIGHYTSETDKLIESLQNDMIKLLNYPGLDRFIRSQDTMPAFERDSTLLGLHDSLAPILENELVSSVYLYFPHEGIVIDSRNGHFPEQMFFDYTHVMTDLAPSQREAMFAGRKMMALTGPLTIEEHKLLSRQVLTTGRYISAAISYPFNSNSPSVYLVAAINLEKLKEQITIPEEHLIDAAIMNKDGEVIAYTGRHELEGEDLLEAYRADNKELSNLTMDGIDYSLKFDHSARNDWIYVALADSKQIRQSSDWIKLGSAAFLIFFLVAGAVVSYYLSRRMYMPIRHITTELSEGRPVSSSSDRPDSGNEYDLIKQWSRLLVQEHKGMSNLIEGITPTIHEHFLEKVLSGELKDELAVEYYAKEIDLDRRLNGRLAVLGVDIQYREPEKGALTETDKSFYMVDLKNDLTRALDHEVWFCLVRKDLLACIVHLSEHEEEALQAAETVRLVLTDKLDRYHSAVGVGRAVEGVWRLSESYRHALYVLGLRRLRDDVELCVDQSEGEERAAQDSFLPAQAVNQMLNMYKSGQRDQMLEAVCEWLDSRIRDDMPAVQIKQLCVDILNTWLRATGVDNKQDYSLERNALLFKQLNECATAGDLYRFLERAHAELFASTPQEPLPQRFETVLDKIDMHYGSELSIEQFAKEMNMSVGHFSRSFKEAVGEKYMDYLLRRRLDEAKRLLLGTDLKIDDIALRVGYLSRNSFIKAFRKNEGVTPGKYRESSKP